MSGAAPQLARGEPRAFDEAGEFPPNDGGMNLRFAARRRGKPAIGAGDDEMAAFLFREQGTFDAFDRAELAPDGDAFERAQLGAGARERVGERKDEGADGGLGGVQASAGADVPR